MNRELIEAIDALEKQKDISRESMFEAIEMNLVVAYKNNFNKADNVEVSVDRETGDFHIYSKRTVVEAVENSVTEISLEDARKINAASEIGDVVNVEVEAKEFGRISAQSAKNGIFQRLKEEEKKNIYDKFSEKKDDIVTGIVQRINGRNISVNLGKTDAVLVEKEQAKGEFFSPTDRIKLYVVDVKDTAKGPKIMVSRKDARLVKRLFEKEVTEIKEGIVEIKSIAREAGSRTKMAVWSNSDKVDPVGACVGVNGSRVDAVVDELFDEKIDIINWDENPALFIENALSPSKVISVLADPDNREAIAIVPDKQLSLAIGKSGQNARLAARLTGYKIDIKSESQAKEEGIQYVFKDTDYIDDTYYDDEYYDDEYYDDEYYDDEYKDDELDLKAVLEAQSDESKE